MNQPGLFSEESLRGPGGRAALAQLKDRCTACTKCALSKTRTQVVFGEGEVDRPPVCFVGEGPGENEDRQGRPFIGKAGQLLDKMIEAMGFARSQVYICNVVNCRPPGNRKPEDEEIKQCREFLVGQLAIVQPRIVVLLGATAAQAILKTTKAMKDLRGQWYEWEGVPVRATYHPAYLLRSPHEKSKCWEDLQAVLAQLKILDSRARQQEQR